MGREEWKGGGEGHAAFEYKRLTALHLTLSNHFFPPSSSSIPCFIKHRYLSQAFPEDVVTVLHPALPSCPGHEFYLRDYTGCCSLFSVVLHPKYSEEAMHAMLDSYHLFAIGASWGGFESLVLPTTKTITRSIEPVFPLLVGPTARFHVGLEEVEDLKADLRRGMELLRAFGDGGK